MKTDLEYLKEAIIKYQKKIDIKTRIQAIEIIDIALELKQKDNEEINNIKE